MKRRYLVKLVRDRMGGLLGDCTVEYAPIPDGEELRKLRRGKLVEEAVEYLLDGTLDELADVVEAVRTLARVEHGKPLAAVVLLADQKAHARGGFGSGMGMWAIAGEGATGAAPTVAEAVNRAGSG